MENPELHWNGNDFSLLWNMRFAGKEKVLFRGISEKGDLTGGVAKLTMESGMSPFLFGGSGSLSCFWLGKKEENWVLTRAWLIPLRVGGK